MDSLPSLPPLQVFTGEPLHSGAEALVRCALREAGDKLWDSSMTVAGLASLLGAVARLHERDLAADIVEPHVVVEACARLAEPEEGGQTPLVAQLRPARQEQLVHSLMRARWGGGAGRRSQAGRIHWCTAHACRRRRQSM